MEKRSITIQLKHKKAQSIIEFTFAMILIALFIFGMVRVFQWSGLIIAEQRLDHDTSLIAVERNPWVQLREDFYKPRKMDAVFRWNK